MSRSALDVYADLPVGRKLLIGSGLVLILVLVLALAGFFAVNTLLERHQRTSVMVDVTEGVLQARRAEKNLASGDEGAADEVRRLLGEVDGHLDALAQVEGYAERVTQLRASADSYLKQFEAYAAGLQKAAAARQAMDEAAGEARDQFEGIELSMFDAVRELRLAGDRLRGSDPLTLAETASGLSKRMLDLRSQETLFIIDGKADAAEEWSQIYDDQSSIGKNLGIWLDDEQKATLGEALAALGKYHDAFEAYRQAREAVGTAQKGMVEQARAMMEEASRQQADEEQAMALEGRNVRLLLAGVTLLAVVLGLFAAWFNSRMIVAPLRQAVELARRVADGDLRSDTRRARGDEIGELTGALDGMAAGLRELIGNIGGVVSRIASAAAQLSSVTAQTSANVQTQRSETEQTATAMNQMAATVQEVAQNAEQASHAAEQADREAQQGNQVAQQTVRQMDELASDVESTAQAMTELGEESARIGGVLEVIRTVAEQTNLLALNAAIEAARAGEQGRGFAVVADEVRALAKRTHESTEQIETLIAGLQARAQQAQQRMQSSLELTRASVGLAGDAGSALGSIAMAVSTIEQMNQQIAASAEEQSAVAENISESLTRIRDIGEQSAEASSQIAEASAELARLGEELQQRVGRFRR